MKKSLFFLIFLLTFGAFAQEMDTTFVVNQNGETIGIIHKRGEAPVIPSNISSANAMAPAPVATQVPMDQSVNYADSVTYYQRLAEESTISGHKLRSAGSGLMIGGGIGTGVGIGLLIAGLSTETYNYKEDQYEMTGGGAAMYLIGYVLTCTMPELFITGIVLKCVGGARLRNAARREQTADYFKSLSNPMSSLRISPTVNPLNRSLGGNLAFNF